MLRIRIIKIRRKDDDQLRIKQVTIQVFKEAHTRESLPGSSSSMEKELSKINKCSSYIWNTGK